MTPAQFKARLEEVAPERNVAKLCDATGLAGRVIASAYAGRAISIDAYLKICGAVGVDPKDGLGCEQRRVGDLDWGLIRIGLLITRQLKRHSMRNAHDASCASTTALWRIENAEPVEVRNYLNACSYIGVHPWAYCREVVGKPGTFHGKQVVEHAA